MTDIEQIKKSDTVFQNNSTTITVYSGLKRPHNIVELMDNFKEKKRLFETR